MVQTLLALANSYLGVSKYDDRHRQLVKDYNHITPLPVGYQLQDHDDWCAAFVTVIGDKLNVPGLIPRECSVQRMITLCQDRGIWLGKQRPQAGNLIFWDWNHNNWSDHVGFVENVTADGRVVTIEGNSNQRVEKHSYHYLDATISGYARPRYLKDVAESQNHSAKPTDIDQIVSDVIAGKYGNGLERERHLAQLGVNPQDIQARVNQRLNNNTTQATLASYDSRITEIAREVIAGKWGNGGQRIKQLTAAGHDPATIQREVNRLMNEMPVHTSNITTLAQEVVSGKWGNGADRRRRLSEAGHNATQVQEEVNRLLACASSHTTTAITPITPITSATPATSTISPTTSNSTQNVTTLPMSKKYRGLHYQGRSISGEIIAFIALEAKKYDIQPAFLIVMLDYEALWGASRVAKTDNNWGGMTWNETYVGHPDVLKAKGSPRPESEGGHYIFYTSVTDFIRDWLYLLRPDYLYQVSGKATLTEFVKGLFKVGGAKYDYASIGYTDYLNGMVKRYQGILEVNGELLKEL